MTKNKILRYLALRIDQVVCSHDAINVFVFTDEGEQDLIQLGRKKHEDDDALIIRAFKEVERIYPIENIR